MCKGKKDFGRNFKIMSVNFSWFLFGKKILWYCSINFLSGLPKWQIIKSFLDISTHWHKIYVHCVHFTQCRDIHYVYVCTKSQVNDFFYEHFLSFVFVFRCFTQHSISNELFPDYWKNFYTVWNLNRFGQRT